MSEAIEDLAGRNSDARHEYRIFLERVQRAPKGAKVLVRPTSSVRSLPLQFGTLR